MKKRLLSLLAAAAIGLTTLSGCGSVSGSKSDTSSGSITGTAEERVTNISSGSDAGKDVTLTMWTWNASALQPVLDKYTEENPNVHFEMTSVEYGDYMTKIQQALASGSEIPTLIIADYSLIAQWKTIDIFEDLRNYGFSTDDFLDTYKDITTDDDGRMVFVCSGVAPSAIAYKRDLAKQYFGTDDPDELYKIFNSYDVYVEQGKKVAEESDGSAMLFHSAQSIGEWFYNASDVETQTGNTINYTEKMTDVLEKVLALRDADAVDTYQNGTPEANATYGDDIHIMYHTPDWACLYYIEANDADGSGNWGIMHAPKDYASGGGGYGISSLATEEQKKAAADFLKWMLEGDGAYAIRDDAGMITACKKLLEQPDFLKRTDDAYFGGEDIGKLYYQEVTFNMDVKMPSVWENAVVSVRNDIIQRAVDNPEMTMDEALAVGKDELTQLITDSEIVIE